MSSVLSPTTPLLNAPNGLGGFNIIGFEDLENRLNGTNGDDKLRGGALNDVLDGGLGNDLIEGRAGNDLILGSGGNDVIRAGEGNDTVFGGIGNDIIIGGDGNDIIRGGLGEDYITGGLGRDTFEFFSDDITPGVVDKIVDFTKGEDAIKIENINIGIGNTIIYDNSTGKVFVKNLNTNNQVEIIQLDPGLNLNVQQNGDDFDLF
jgi:Ca2+-binding RTX toxin-like protein